MKANTLPVVVFRHGTIFQGLCKSITYIGLHRDPYEKNRLFV